MYKSETDFFVKFHTFFPTHIVKCIPDRKIAHRMPFRTCPRCRRQCKQRKRHCPTFSLAIYQLHPLVTGRMCQNPTQENCLVGWQKHRTSLGKSTEVCIKEVRCFGFPDWRSVPNIGRDTDFDNKTINNRQLYNAKKRDSICDILITNGIPSERIADTL